MPRVPPAWVNPEEKQQTAAIATNEEVFVIMMIVIHDGLGDAGTMLICLRSIKALFSQIDPLPWPVSQRFLTGWLAENTLRRHRRRNRARRSAMGGACGLFPNGG